MDKLKVPPHSQEAEQSVIGAMLIAPTAWDIVVEVVKSEDFYNRSHKLIFQSIEKMITECKPIDLVTLSEEMEKAGTLEDAGGFVYLGDIAKNTPSAANVKAYSEIVRERSVMRSLIAASNEISENAYNHKGEVKELVAVAEKCIGDVSESISKNKEDTSVKAALLSYMNDFEKMSNSNTGLIGISTGLSDLDNLTGGLAESDLIVLAARPSMGKTAMAMNIVRAEALSGGYPLVFSLEMPAKQLAMRILSDIGSLELGYLKMPKSIPPEYQDEFYTKQTGAIGRVMDTNLEIDDESGLSVMDLRIRARQYLKRHGNITLIMVDYLQLMKGTNKENRTLEVAEISNGLKAIAKEFKCPVLALSQLNRSLESRANKRPVNSDLKESGSIEQDADVIIMLYRDEVYNEMSPDKGLAEILVTKARNGPVGKVGACFQGQYSRFTSLANREIVGASGEYVKPLQR